MSEHGGDQLRFFLGAFGQPGHAFPMLALGAELVARGHAVTYETWSRWREHVEAQGMSFVASPEYPTFRESGVDALKDYAVEVYYGLMTRSGTPSDIVARLDGDLRKVIAMPDFTQRISVAGIDMFPKSAPQMAAIMSADVTRFRDVIREAGIRPE